MEIQAPPSGSPTGARNSEASETLGKILKFIDFAKWSKVSINGLDDFPRTRKLTGSLSSDHLRKVQSSEIKKLEVFGTRKEYRRYKECFLETAELGKPFPRLSGAAGEKFSS